MTKFLQRRFSVSAPITEEYERNWERIFGRKEEPLEELDSQRLEFMETPGDGAGGDLIVVSPENRIEELESKKDASFGHLIGVEEDELTALKFLNVGMPKVIIARTELEKWLSSLDVVFTSDSKSHVALGRVVESIKLVLQADRISDPLAMKK